jgi:PKD repeat protein
MKRMIFSLFSVVMLIAITLPATSPPAVVAQPPLSLECLVSPNPTEVGHETDFLAVASGGVSPYSWLWMIDDVEVATTQNTTYTFATAGNYTVCVNVTDFLGNENQSCMSVTVNPALVMECLVSPNPTKVGHATDFLAAAIGGVPPYSWLWMIDDVEVATTQNTTYTFATAGDYTVCVTVNDSLGNEEKCCTSVTVNPAPNEEYHLFIDVPNKDITITNAEETTWLLIGSVYYGGGHCSNVAADLLVDGSQQ